VSCLKLSERLVRDDPPSPQVKDWGERSFAPKSSSVAKRRFWATLSYPFRYSQHQGWKQRVGYGILSTLMVLGVLALGVACAFGIGVAVVGITGAVGFAASAFAATTAVAGGTVAGGVSMLAGASIAAAAVVNMAGQEVNRVFWPSSKDVSRAAEGPSAPVQPLEKGPSSVASDGPSVSCESTRTQGDGSPSPQSVPPTGRLSPSGPLFGASHPFPSIPTVDPAVAGSNVPRSK
jgi:hypothetical protein